MSGGHFAGLLTPLTCQGSKGQSPLASLGTAQRLAPVQSGLPLCETCLSSPHHWISTSQVTFLLCVIQPTSRWRWFCGAGTDCGRKRKAPLSIDFLFLKQAVRASLRCEVSDNHVPYPALYSFLHLACSIHPSTNAFLLYFPVISVFLLLDLFPALLKDIKIAVITIF